MENETPEINQGVSDIPQVTSSDSSKPNNFFSDLSKKFERMNKKSLMLIIGGLLFGILIGTLFSGGITGAAVSTGDVKDTFSELFPQATVTDVQDQGSFWNVSLLSETASGMQEGGVLVTKDGKYLVIGSVINLDDVRAELKNQSESETEVEVPKSDKPKVELFVMSYCPFGLQAEKALIPARNLLKDVADFEIKFVHYLMHGEKEAVENLRQYCIQKSDEEKFWSYLKCFAESDGAESAADKCMVTAGVDKASTDTCIADARKEFKVDEDIAAATAENPYPRFRVNEEASKAYGVEGSPTLIINGEVASAQRNPDAVKKAICSAFNEEPSACETALATTASSAGFGADAGSDSGASCG